MARFFNLESLGVLVLCLAVGIGGCFALGLGWPQAIGLGLVFSILAFFPVASALQDKLIEVYAHNGKFERALDLAIVARDTAPSTRLRNRAEVDVALLHLMRRDYKNALSNLERVKLSLVGSDAGKAVVQGHQAYCLAHLERDLERAEELARAASKAVPEEPVFTYFVGLTLLKAGKLAEAEPFIAESLEKNADAEEPFPGERHWALAFVRAAQGKDVEPAKSSAVAAGGHFAEQARALGQAAPHAG
jgi:predicted Zn-dependent protease